MKINKYQVGRLGEQIAQKVLKNKGFLVIASNFKVRGGEIDLICQKGKKYYFIEVKTRTNAAFGSPEEAFTFTKRKRLKTAIFKYLAQTNKPLKWQIDLISIELNKQTKKAKVRHYKNLEL